MLKPNPPDTESGINFATIFLEFFFKIFEILNSFFLKVCKIAKLRRGSAMSNLMFYNLKKPLIAKKTILGIFYLSSYGTQKHNQAFMSLIVWYQEFRSTLNFLTLTEFCYLPAKIIILNQIWGLQTTSKCHLSLIM